MTFFIRGLKRLKSISGFAVYLLQIALHFNTMQHNRNYHERTQWNDAEFEIDVLPYKVIT